MDSCSTTFYSNPGHSVHAAVKTTVASAPNEPVQNEERHGGEKKRCLFRLSLGGTAAAQTGAELGLVVTGGTLLLLTVITAAVVLTVTTGAVSTLGTLYKHERK